MVGISADDVATSAKLATKLGTEFPLLVDPDREVIGAYGVADPGNEISLPATFVIDSGGQIVFVYVGESPRDRPLLEKVLAALPD